MNREIDGYDVRKYLSSKDWEVVYLGDVFVAGKFSLHLEVL